MTPLRPMTHKRSALYMLAHDEWCSHDEADDGIECDCHLSVIASLHKQLEAAERALRFCMEKTKVITDHAPEPLATYAFEAFETAEAALAGENASDKKRPSEKERPKEVGDQVSAVAPTNDTQSIAPAGVDILRTRVCPECESVITAGINRCPHCSGA